ncbi:hypothetical protein MRB53_039097 [Persea americana]|nr:hypothetical protein MRB53_039097 [Persea americana]
MRRRLQVPQKSWVMLVMKPTRPRNPGTCHVLEVSIPGIAETCDVGIPGADELQHLGVGEHLVPRPLVPAKGHVLDEAHLQVLLAGGVDEAQDLLVVDAAHGDAVDLQPHAGAPGVHLLDARDALHDGVEAIAARQQRELQGIQRVEADVDARSGPAATRSSSWRCSVMPLVTPQAAHQRDQVLVDGRFAARQPDLGHALLHEQLAQIEDLRAGQHLPVWEQVDALGGHAVFAAQVAPLREGRCAGSRAGGGSDPSRSRKRASRRAGPVAGVSPLGQTPSLGFRRGPGRGRTGGDVADGGRSGVVAAAAAAAGRRPRARERGVTIVAMTAAGEYEEGNKQILESPRGQRWRL